MLNLSVLVEASASKYPTSPAFTFGETTLNYAQVNGAANQVANGLNISSGTVNTAGGNIGGAFLGTGTNQNNTSEQWRGAVKNWNAAPTFF